VACQVLPSIVTVASGLALRLWYQAGCAAKVGRDEAHAVGVRDSEHRDGARLPRFGAGGGEDDRRQADRDPSEATLAAGQLGDELVEMVCGRAEERPPTFVAARLRIIR